MQVVRQMSVWYTDIWRNIIMQGFVLMVAVPDHQAGGLRKFPDIGLKSRWKPMRVRQQEVNKDVRRLTLQLGRSSRVCLWSRLFWMSFVTEACTYCYNSIFTGVDEEGPIFRLLRKSNGPSGRCGYAKIDEKKTKIPDETWNIVHDVILDDLRP